MKKQTQFCVSMIAKDRLDFKIYEDKRWREKISVGNCMMTISSPAGLEYYVLVSIRNSHF